MNEWTANGLGLDYFLLYRFVIPYTFPTKRTAELLDQFDKDVVMNVRLVFLSGFADRADKNNEGLYDKNAHLTNYVLSRLPDSQPNRQPVPQIKVSNQFYPQGQRIEIREVVSLLVPAQKRISPQKTFSAESKKLDHYKVYRIGRVFGPVVDHPFVDFVDQFGDHKGIKVLQPQYFAVPVYKKFPPHSAIRNHDAHLTIYKVEFSDFFEEVQFKDKQFTIDFKDQFLGKNGQRISWIEYLAVPSKKVIIPTDH